MNAPLIIAIILILAYLVCLGFSSKVWRWFHLTMAFFVFGSACWFLCMAAFVNKTRSTWQKKHDQLETKKQELDEQYQQVVKGPVNKVKEDRENLQDLDSMLTRLLLDLGRVWRQTKPQGVQNNAVLINTDPGNTRTNDEALQIEQNAVLYVFKETAIQVEGMDVAVPVKYLGEFYVNGINGDVISLLPSPITPPAIAAPHINDGSTWAIYEKMPVDGHRLFSETDIFDSDVVLGEDPAPLFGKMDEVKISGAFQMAVQHNPDLNPRQQERIGEHIDRYMRDGRQLLENEASTGENWIKVLFNEKYEVTVDSDAAKAGLTESFFDPGGMAVIPNLRRGETVEFEKGDIGVFHLDSRPDGFVPKVPKPVVPDGQTLTAEGTARQLTVHYVRPLSDYAFIFHDIHDRINRVFRQQVLYDKENVRLAESLRTAELQVAFREGEKSKLTTEKGFQEKDRDTAEGFIAQLTEERESLRADLERLFDENRKLTRQLAEIQSRLEAEINKRTDAVGRDSD